MRTLAVCWWDGRKSAVCGLSEAWVDHAMRKLWIFKLFTSSSSCDSTNRFPQPFFAFRWNENRFVALHTLKLPCVRIKYSTRAFWDSKSELEKQIFCFVQIAIDLFTFLPAKCLCWLLTLNSSDYTSFTLRGSWPCSIIIAIKSF